MQLLIFLAAYQSDMSPKLLYQFNVDPSSCNKSNNWFSESNWWKYRLPHTSSSISIKISRARRTTIVRILFFSIVGPFSQIVPKMHQIKFDNIDQNCGSKFINSLQVSSCLYISTSYLFVSLKLYGLIKGRSCFITDHGPKIRTFQESQIYDIATNFSTTTEFV